MARKPADGFQNRTEEKELDPVVYRAKRRYESPKRGEVVNSGEVCSYVVGRDIVQRSIIGLQGLLE